MSRKYFGTDGVRGRVGELPMTPELMLKLGWAAGRVLGKAGGEVLIGKDTRRSGYLFESALEAGFAAAGANVGLLGPLPTPAVAFLTRSLGAQAGVVISASHNPHHDNGVKLFGADGGKLADEIEHRIEALMEDAVQCVAPEQVGAARRIDDARKRYVDFCVSCYHAAPLAGMTIAIDCANGAGYLAGPEVLERLGANLIAIGNHPDGFNINRECGSTHLGALVKAVREHRAQLGIALDGDGDRCLMVDAQGNEVDGDQILYIIAAQRLHNGLLRGPVVGTLMSNLGLEIALRKLGLEFERAPVGDRYVMELLRRKGGLLGGETSGHTLCLDRATTGDGIVTALQVLETMMQTGKGLAELAAPVEKCPQVLINLPVQGKARALLESEAMRAALRDAEATLGSGGRVLLRASGTEPLVRVMVEAHSAQLAHEQAARLADCVRAEAAAAASRAA